MTMETAVLSVMAITFFASFLNGGVGYGFSTVTVPIALIYHSNRILNPAIVLIEIGVNFYSLVLNRGSIHKVFPRLKTILIGIIPGIALGAYLLNQLDPTWAKLMTYCLLTPLILLQGIGFRYPLRCEGKTGYGLGGSVGVLYSVTTISGPPLAMMLINEGYEPKDFKAALGIIRFTESTVTGLVYLYLGYYSVESLKVAQTMIPMVLIGMPLGSYLISKFEPHSFRRVCISIDCWLISFGLIRSMSALLAISQRWLLAAGAAIVLVDLCTFRLFFKNVRKDMERKARKSLEPTSSIKEDPPKVA